MKNTKLVIALIASALTLGQVVHAVPETLEEWHEFYKHQASQAAQAQPTSTPACVTVNKQELSDTIKAAVADALAKMTQKSAQKQPATEHLITRKDKKTHIGLDQNSNDTYSVTLHEGDELILHTHTATGTWVIDVMTSPLYSGILRYTNMLVAESYPSQDSMYFKAHKEGYTTLKFRYLLPDGTSNTQNLIINIIDPASVKPAPASVIPEPALTLAPAIPSVRPSDRAVEIGKNFIIEKEEDIASGETHYFDKSYSSNDLFELVDEYYATENPGVKKSHYFVFKAIKVGTGNLNIIGGRNQPQQMWQSSYLIKVEEPKGGVAPKPFVTNPFQSVSGTFPVAG